MIPAGRPASTALRAWNPDIVLLREPTAPAGIIAGLHAHLWRTANELGMTPLLGPPGPLSVTGNHPTVLVRTSGGLTIVDAGPPLRGVGGGPAPAWCQALIQVPGMPLADPVHKVAKRAAPDDVVSVSYAGNDPLVLAHDRALLTGPPGTTGHIDAGLNHPGTLLKAGRYPGGRRAVTSCSVI